MVNQINNLSLTQSNLPSGGSGGDGPHLFLDQTEAWRAEKTFVETLPLLISGSWWPALPPPPPPCLKIWIRHCSPHLPVSDHSKWSITRITSGLSFWEEAPTHLLFGREFIDLSRIPVKKGIKSRVGWTKHSDLYEIVHPNLVLIFLCLLTGAECGKGLLHAISKPPLSNVATCSHWKFFVYSEWLSTCCR